MNRFVYLIIPVEELHDIGLLLEDGDLVGALEDVESIMESAPHIHVNDRELGSLVDLSRIGEYPPEVGFADLYIRRFTP